MITEARNFCQTTIIVFSYLSWGSFLESLTVFLKTDDFIQRLAFPNQPQSFGSEAFLTAGIADGEQNYHPKIFRNL